MTRPRSQGPTLGKVDTMAIELTEEEAHALVLLIWRYADPNASYQRPGEEALRTANNKLVTAFGL